MPKFKVKVARRRTVIEAGFVEIEADCSEEALDLVSQGEDPPMDYVEGWVDHCKYSVVGIQP